MRSDPGAISFDPVTADHYPLLRSWLDTPHWRQWWGEPEEEFGLIRDMVEGRDSTRPFIVMLDGEPVGYIQMWYLGDHQNATWIEDHPLLAAFPPESVGVDISIGEETKLSRGIGSAALRAFVDGIRAERARPIIIDPEPGNARAIRAYEKAGFRPVESLIGRTDGALIMQYQTHEIELTA